MAYDKKWYVENRQYRIDQMRDYRLLNKDKLALKRRKRYQENKTMIQAKNSNYYHTVYKIKFPERLKKSKKKYKNKIRLDVLGRYSDGDPKCACCDEKELTFLTIDHINGGGNKHRKKVGGGGWYYYLWLKKNNYPKGYQVLCMNCNFARRYDKICPHQV